MRYLLQSRFSDENLTKTQRVRALINFSNEIKPEKVTRN